VGAGGREHALAWALAHAPQVSQVFVAPGNAGTCWDAQAGWAAAQNVPLAVDDHPALVAFAQQQRIDLAVVGPEAPLVAGLADQLRAAGVPVFGPGQAASQLEGSKAFAKAFMQQQGIPTADYALFHDYAPARRYVQERAAPDGTCPLVIKADGLAAGKGVAVCATQDEALNALARTMEARAFGAAGAAVVIEERLSGPEVSLLALCDGTRFVVLPPARDHKRVYEHDQGPNTGGMGAYSPVPGVDAALIADLAQTIVQPTVAGMAAQNMPYVGVLYVGIILTAHGPRVLEYNCRFGDPEAQAVLPLVDNLWALMHACAVGDLGTHTPQVQAGACATVVLTAPGYPGSYPKGMPISGLAQVPDDVLVFHAGTAMQDGQLVTNGGRVLACSGRGANLEAALARAYSGVAQIQFDGMHYRRDIGRTHGEVSV
jgi:phosphoribosylamine--glycine ligase